MVRYQTLMRTRVNVTGNSILRFFGIPRNGRKSEKHSAATASEDNVTASFAHDINNPLQSLINLLYLMGTEASLAGNARHYLTLAREEAHRISQITHAAMNGFQNAAGPVDANVAEILHSVLQFYKSRFE